MKQTTAAFNVELVWTGADGHSKAHASRGHATGRTMPGDAGRPPGATGIGLRGNDRWLRKPRPGNHQPAKIPRALELIRLAENLQ